jgi:hypothetical protein
MSGKKHGNSLVGGDKKTRDKVNRNNPRGNKHGGNKTKERRNRKAIKRFNSRLTE